jgi:hypothetical protein
MPWSTSARAAAIGTVVVGLVVVGAATLHAHKSITSRYTYNDDVYPILRDRCGQCHVDGGPAPMSLLTYNEDGGAVAYAESIKEMLIANAMPPYYADPMGPAVKHPHYLSPRELDILLTWTSGGTPHGDLNHNPPVSKATTAWSLGPPDIVLPLPVATTLAAGELEHTVDVVVPTSFSTARWLRAADLMPGTPSMVRQATISIDQGPVVALWEPQHDASAAPEGTAFILPAGASIKLRIRYRKSWQDEQQVLTDKSRLGLYFAKTASPHALKQQIVDGTTAAPMSIGGRVLALRCLVDQPYFSVEITATSPSGKKTSLLKLRGPRPEWPRRYWLVDPIDLPAGSQVQITTTALENDNGPLGPKVESPLQAALDFVES